MAAEFMLVEFLDPTVNSFLWRAREILGSRRSRSPIHLTIRGPYSSRDNDALARTTEALRYDVFRIWGGGRFSNAGDEVAYINVDSPNLRCVWWKPDYPIERYGFFPHVSLYRGRDREFADAVKDFLEREHVELFCAEHQVAWYEPTQPSLLSRREPTIGDMVDMDTSKRVDVTILDRLQELVDGYRGAAAGRLG